LAIEGFAGVTAIDCRVAPVTVNPKVLDVTPLNDAVIFEVPVPTPVARPVAEMVATPAAEDAHVTWAEMFEVELSLNVPVAVN